MRRKNLFFKTLCIFMVVMLISALPVHASDDFSPETEVGPGPDQVMLTITLDNERVTNVPMDKVCLGSVPAEFIGNGSYWFYVEPGTYSVTIPGFDTTGATVTKVNDEGASLELSYVSFDNDNTTITLAGDVLIHDGTEKAQEIACVKVAGISEPLVEGADYYIDKSNHQFTDRAVAAGSYQLKICGMGKFVGEATCDWVIAGSKSELSDQIAAKVKAEINMDADVPQVALATSTDKLPAAILSADTAVDLISKGGTLNLQIGTVDASSRKELTDFADGWTVGQCLSINLVFTGNKSGKVYDISETSSPLKLTISLPAKLKDDSKRSFGVVRSHKIMLDKKKLDFLDNTSYKADSGTMTFDNDKFSDFAIVYKDKDVTPLKPTDHTKDKGIVPVIYTVNKGEGQTYILNSGRTLSFTCDGAFYKFTGIKVDGKDVAAANYTAVSGSTVVTLKNEYLETLSAGNHTLQFIYSDSESNMAKFTVQKASMEPTKSVNPTPSQSGDNSHVKLNTEKASAEPDESSNAVSPKTGDHNHLVLLAALLGLTGFALVTSKLYSRKKKQ